MLENEDVLGYYRSRLDRGEEYASLAIDVVTNRGLGKTANLWLFRNVALELSRDEQEQLLDGGTYLGFVRRVNIGIARAHADAVDRDFTDRSGRVPGLLSADQISAYHERFFIGLGLPRHTFGGSAFFGVRTEFWCPSCDTGP